MQNPSLHTYGKILEDVMGRFSPSEKMSEVFSKLAEKYKEEEGQVTPSPIGIPTKVPIQMEIAEQHLSVPPTSQTHGPEPETTKSTGDREQKEEFEERVESEKGNDEAEDPEDDITPEPVEKKQTGKESVGKALEVVNVDEEESEEGEETLTQMAVRRIFRAGRRIDPEEPRTLREEAELLVAAKREAAERKMKGKQVATPSKIRKSRPAAMGIVIREVAASPT